MSFSFEVEPYNHFTIIQNFCENNHKKTYTILMNHRLRILPLLLVAMFASCTPATSEQMSKNAFSEHEIVIIQQIKWADILSQKESHYLVFFYSETCAHCHEIMGDVIVFSESDIVKTYFLDIKQSETKIPIKNEVDETIGASSIDDLFIAGTPTIIDVEEGMVMANVPGKDDCLSFLNEQRLIHK